MGIREELSHMVGALNREGCGVQLGIRDEEFTELEQILRAHPDLWPVALAETLQVLRRKLSWEPIDRSAIPAGLTDFFDAKFKRDLDPMALARQIGHDIRSACEECGCKC